VAKRLLELAATIRREDAPANGLPPYKGLYPFNEADAELFFGREALPMHCSKNSLPGWKSISVSCPLSALQEVENRPSFAQGWFRRCAGSQSPPGGRFSSSHLRRIHWKPWQLF
jgi:hypothetical protein